MNIETKQNSNNEIYKVDDTYEINLKLQRCTCACLTIIVLFFFGLIIYIRVTQFYNTNV